MQEMPRVTIPSVSASRTSAWGDSAPAYAEVLRPTPMKASPQPSGSQRNSLHIMCNLSAYIFILLFYCYFEWLQLWQVPAMALLVAASNWPRCQKYCSYFSQSYL
jgi:hypothetical protein